jgi:uncharacterized protein (DUF2141 family)
MCESKSHHRVLVSLGLTLVAALCIGPAAAGGEGETLTVDVSGLKHKRGKLVAKLFRRGDGAPKGQGYRRIAKNLTSTQPKLEFRGVPYGQYALFLFHDENDNGTVDHNLLGIPSEPLGFSAEFRPSLFSGIPDFDDLQFSFSKANRVQRVIVE